MYTVPLDRQNYFDIDNSSGSSNRNISRTVMLPVDEYRGQFYSDPLSTLCVQCQRINFQKIDSKDLIECTHLIIPSARSFQRPVVPTVARQDLMDDSAANNQSHAEDLGG